jgi:hypothetical protein
MTKELICGLTALVIATSLIGGGAALAFEAPAADPLPMAELNAA